MRHLIAVSFLILMSATATAQPTSVENHYRAHSVDFPSNVFRSISLVDQWGQISFTTLTLRFFAPPVQVDGVAPVDPRVHQSWWDLPLGLSTDERLVGVDNSLGRQDWIVRGARHLVAPASLWQPTPLEFPWNYYLCYDAEGPSVAANVTVVHGNSTSTSTVAVPALFCNPVQMDDLTEGNQYQIQEPEVRLACYDLDLPSRAGQFIFTLDAFGAWYYFTLPPDGLVCLPTTELQIVATEESSWGRLKALYDE